MSDFLLNLFLLVLIAVAVIFAAVLVLAERRERNMATELDLALASLSEIANGVHRLERGAGISARISAPARSERLKVRKRALWRELAEPLVWMVAAVFWRRRP